jgi:hypothetical protein
MRERIEAPDAPSRASPFARFRALSRTNRLTQGRSLVDSYRVERRSHLGGQRRAPRSTAPCFAATTSPRTAERREWSLASPAARRRAATSATESAAACQCAVLDPRAFPTRFSFQAFTRAEGRPRPSAFLFLIISNAMLVHREPAARGELTSSRLPPTASGVPPRRRAGARRRRSSRARRRPDGPPAERAAAGGTAGGVSWADP